MKNPSTNTNRWNTLGDLLLPIVIALLFLAFTYSFYPFREKLQFDSDEGLNLMRSMLVVKGYPLYAQVSSDQPPLFNQLLGLVFRVAGFEVNPARFLVLLFSTLLVWACAQFMQISWGKLAAIMFLPLIVLTPQYLRLSVSVMIGVPSIALAAVSMLFAAVWHRRGQDVWLILSGFALALSVLIKLFTGFVAPIFLIGITASEYLRYREDGFSWKILKPALIWSLCFGGLALLLGVILIGPQHLPSVILPHVAAPTEEGFQAERFTMNDHLQAALPLLFLSVMGVLISVYRKKWLMLYPLAWSLLAYGLFSFYSPVFYHHQLLITVPAALIAAAGAGQGILSLIYMKRVSDLVRFQSILGLGALIVFVFVAFSYLPVLDKELMDSPQLTDFSLQATPGKLKVLRTMEDYSKQTHWIVTDMPMYAFRVQRPVPPILATFSSKRLATGSLSEEDILAAMREYKPEQVLMARFVIPGLEEYLKENYTLVRDAEYFRLFIRNDLSPAGN